MDIGVAIARVGEVEGIEGIHDDEKNKIKKT